MWAPARVPTPALPPYGTGRQDASYTPAPESLPGSRPMRRDGPTRPGSETFAFPFLESVWDNQDIGRERTPVARLSPAGRWSNHIPPVPEGQRDGVPPLRPGGSPPIGRESFR